MIGRQLLSYSCLLMILASVLEDVSVWAQKPDYSKPNWANSPPLHKFVDGLPGLGPDASNNLGQYIPIAVPDTVTFPESDYYEMGLKDYSRRMHSDLPATKLRGYYQINGPDPSSQYLGPLILAKRNRPVRMKLTNQLGVGSNGNLFLPLDTTIKGAGKGPDGSMYPQNRATLHLHGGAPPWISDGTPHQWITPAKETASLRKGLDVVNVPDMPSPGRGSQTFYWPNQQSGRLMFYHDHAYGITHLNVYAGEAAGYLLLDPAEEDALQAVGVPGTIPSSASPDLAHLIPLVIQDRTFVADDTTPTVTDPGRFTLATDPLWKWGAGGNFWFPHVYQPNQMPKDGAFNPMGRWDYGPWMGPPAQVNHTTLPHPSHVPEAFMDTPVINGTAYPFVKVEPAAYRFRILNACNDRFLNLQLYAADHSGKEVTMVPADGTLFPTANQQPGEPAELPVPIDHRAGGVPDPRTAGPPIIQIGTEGGLLPAMTLLPNTPIDFDYDRKSATMGSVRNFTLPPNYPRVGYTLLLGPAERADVVIDFSQFAGKTLILYNDAPAPFPFFDPRVDYYTDGPDHTSAGGAPPTNPGWGPNTRTLMQIQVGAGTPAPFDTTALQAALPNIFSATQPTAIVPPGTHGGNNLWLSRSFAGFPVFKKSVNEEFEPDYGRMTTRLGNNVMTLNSQGIDTFGRDFTEPPREMIPEEGNTGTQVWFIMHLGVDTHPIHFHLLNVQLINRVDLAGVIKPPDPNEMGWKDTVRMNPFENAIVAVQPIKPLLPFQVPTAVRPLDVTQPPTGLPGSVYNVVTNPNPFAVFDWEYVWHCHILGHEEHDMMRPLILTTRPFAPLYPVAKQTGSPRMVSLTWRDNSRNENRFIVERATDAGFRKDVVQFTVGPHNGTYANPGGLGGTVTYQDVSVTPGKTYHYRVHASNKAGASAWARSAPVKIVK